MTMDFFNFGVPVNVTAPPASDVTDGSNLLGGLSLVWHHRLRYGASGLASEKHARRPQASK